MLTDSTTESDRAWICPGDTQAKTSWFGHGQITSPMWDHLHGEYKSKQEEIGRVLKLLYLIVIPPKYFAKHDYSISLVCVCMCVCMQVCM